MGSWWQFRSIPLYKISFCNVVKGRVGCNILFSTSLRILGESPGQSVRGSKLFSITLASLAFFLIYVKAMHHRASTILMVFSDRRSNFLIGFRTIFEFRLRTGRYVTDTQNLIWGLHSVPPYTPYTTELVVAGSKAYWTTSAVRFITAFRSDTSSLASLGRRSGFVAIGFRTGWTLHSQ